MERPLRIGYTTGVFDLFHIGHINILKNARGLCDKLVVGVTVDELVEYIGKRPVIPFEERIEIVRSCKFVDVAIPQDNLDKIDAWERINYSLLFVGDDWFRTDSWQVTQAELSVKGVQVIYFPYTKGVSSTLLNKTLEKLRSGENS